MKGRQQVLSVLTSTLFKVSFRISPLEYARLCKWLSVITSVPACERTFRLYAFYRSEQVHTITYLPKSAHAQTKFGSHFGNRQISLSGFIEVDDRVRFASLIDYLVRMFDVAHLVVFSCK